MRRTIGCIQSAVLLAAVGFGQPPAIPAAPATTRGGTSPKPLVVYLPQQLFNEQEFDPVLGRFARAGVRTLIVSADSGVAVSMSQLIVSLDLALRDVDVADFAGLVLIGGSGAALHWDDSLLQARCREFAASGKIVAAIGIAPVTLARAGVLKGKKATAFSDRATVEWLRKAGARFSFAGVVVDRNIITAASLEQAHAFGQAVAGAVLKGR